MHNLIPFLIRHGYMLLFFWVLAETIGLPIPSVPLLIAVGALAGLGKMNLFFCIGLGVCAALSSDLFWYFMGRGHGGQLLSLLCRISLEPDSCVRHTENIFSRYGARSLLVAKFVPGLSAVSTPLAGMIRMPMPHFLLFDCMGAIFWVSSYTAVGYLLSKELDRASAYAANMGNALLLLVTGGLAMYVLHKYSLRRRIMRELFVARISPEELKQKLDSGDDVMIIDVRHSLDFETEPFIIPGTLRIPSEQLENYPEMPKDREVIVYCT
ncbi:MAG TPA: VTT domain-containing protein [Nitrospirota bacterium]|nr:VTT domain-containing protein [Nitrospirota bacterium]